jgi:hypothetical protein
MITPKTDNPYLIFISKKLLYNFKIKYIGCAKKGKSLEIRRELYPSQHPFLYEAKAHYQN